MASTAARWSHSQRECLEALGLSLWLPRTAATSAAGEGAGTGRLPAQPVSQPPVVVQPVVASAAHAAVATPAAPAAIPAAVPAATLAALRTQVAACTACGLHAGRTQTVFGVGHEQAQWMIVGEGPGEEEDRRGEPFVGPAGQLLNEMLHAIGLAREAVYIANIVKCRPPGNRNPTAEEAGACLGYLRQQIALVRPRLILAVGGVAATHLLQTDLPVGKLRGQRHALPGGGTPVVVTYHPAYLLRSPAEKRKAWQDLQFARQLFATP